MKFTFKTEHPTGQYRSFYPDAHIIKFNKKEVGYISDGEGFRIRLQVVKKDIKEDGNTNCPWKWITLKAKFNSLQEAKEWLNEKVESIVEKWELWQGE